MMKQALALLLAALATAAMAQHPEGYELLHEGDSTRFYKWNDGVACWEDAQNLAQSIGGHLATFHDEGEYNAVFNALSTSDYAWIGLVQEPGSTEPGGGWGWLTGEPLTFTDWNSNEPNQNAGMAEDVGAIWVTKGGWNDTPLCAGEGTLTFIVELTANEVLGCTDPSACNYNPAATADAGNCVSCEFIASFCGPGTTWDSETQTCIVANPADTNLDGCVQLNDLLDVLSAYGDCGVEEAPWACGDPITYQGYDYATVQIGDQCWFAENLRSEAYLNGDTIPANLSDEAWSTTSLGAAAVWGQGSAFCTGENCDISPSDAVDAFGRLYNWYAIADERGLCPDQWKVPTDSDWGSLELQIGLDSSLLLSPGWRGNVGAILKSDEGWNGSNLVGLNLLPTGDRAQNGRFNDNGTQTHFWTTSEDGVLIRRSLVSWYEGIERDTDARARRGMPVRCLQSVE